MKKLLGIAVIACACVLLFAELSEARRGYSYGYRSSSYVRGYTRRDGTYVAPHHRSGRDGIRSNNWTYPGNVNPYTGRVGMPRYYYRSRFGR